MKRTLRWGVPAAIAVVVLGAFLVSRAQLGSTDRDVLRALRADPMATYVPAHVLRALPVATTEGGTALGKPQRGQLNRGFTLREANGEAAFGAALAAARRSGWTVREMDSGSATRRVAYGTKPITGDLFDGQIVMQVAPNLAEAKPGEVVLGIGISASPPR